MQPTDVLRLEPGAALTSSRLRRVAILCIAVLYGGALALLPLEAFLDRANYLVQIQYAEDILLRYWELGVPAALVNEPLWLVVNAGLVTVLSPEAILRIIVFVPATLVAYQVLRVAPGNIVWFVLILLMPQVLKNHVVHLRQGAAVACFLLGWSSSNRAARWGLIGAAPFIHSSFFFILGLMLLARTVKTLRLTPELRAPLFLAVGLAVGLGLGWLAEFVGARQAQEYQFAHSDVSGLGFVFWLAVALVMSLQGREYIRRHTLEIGVVCFYLGTYFFVEVTARIFESAMIPVLLAGMHLTGWRRQLFLSLMVVFGLALWLSKIGQPWFGLGEP
jgi:hypothetical protein